MKGNITIHYNPSIQCHNKKNIKAYKNIIRGKAPGKTPDLIENTNC